MKFVRPLSLLLAGGSLSIGLLLTGCATPIADAYKETRLDSPPHIVVTNTIAGAEMIVLNPLLYYPLELVGIADYDLIWRDEEPPLPEPEAEPYELLHRESFGSDPSLPSGNGESSEMQGSEGDDSPSSLEPGTISEPDPGSSAGEDENTSEPGGTEGS